MCHCNNGPFYYGCQCCKRYDFMSLLFDLFMIMITLGWWVVWIFFRQLGRAFRRRQCC